MKIGTLIFSRLSSKRLPRKALLKILDKSLIETVIQTSKKINSDLLVLATSSEPEDNLLVEIAKDNDIESFQGDLLNVAKRTLECCKLFELDYFVRINGDSPLLPFSILNEAIGSINAQNQPDLISNVVTRTFPYGYSVEIVKVSTFDKHFTEFNSQQREHITSYFYENQKEFDIRSIESNSAKENDCRLVIDTYEDLKVITKIFHSEPYIQNLELQDILSIHKKLKND